MIPTTRPDPDKPIDDSSLDLHARKLVGVKALRDLARFERLTSLPLSIPETLVALLGAALVLGLFVAVGMVLLN